MDKSSRHSKITGDFAEAFVVYWLSKHGYECANVDHTGIDIMASNPNGTERMGISVKCRSRYSGSDYVSVNLPPDGFVKAKKACDDWGLTPYYAILVDGVEKLRCFLMPMSHLLKLVGDDPTKMHYWQMTRKHLESYRRDPLIMQFALETLSCSWRDRKADAASASEEGRAVARPK